MENMENKKIPIFRHLEDNDDLSKNRDGSLLEGQEVVAEKLTKQIYDQYITPDCKAVFIICSSKKRSFETAEIISSNLKEINPELKVRIASEASLREIDQGKIIIPTEYNAGDKFEGLQLAGRIFFKEVFAGDKEGGVDNYSYRYSDPLLLENGNYKYPELLKYFSEPGESYKDILVRVYEQIVHFSNEVDRFNDKTKFIVCSHKQIAQIFEDLLEASDLIEKEKIPFKQGDLPRVCWELFKKRTKKGLGVGEFEFISIGKLFNRKMIELLEKEIEFLKDN